MEENEVSKRNQLIESLLSAETNEELSAILEDTHSADIADILEVLSKDEKLRIVHALKQETITEILPEMDPDFFYLLLDDFGPEYMASILDELPSDEAADIMSELNQKDLDNLLSLMHRHESALVRRVLQYPEDTAGRLMSTDYVAMNENTTPEQAIEYIRSKRQEEPFYYVYVVDNNNKFIGSVPIQKILFASKTSTLGVLIDEEETVSVSTGVDQEEVARLFEKYDIPAVPVVDGDGRLAGRITVDDIIDVIYEENSEDIYRMAGTDYEEVYSDSAFKVARIRLPWLLTCIIGSLLSGAVIHYFEITLSKAIALVSFIPVIMATGGNTGLQSCTIMVRRMALGNVSSHNVFSSIFKEIRTGLILGLVCGSFLCLIAFLWRGDASVGVILGMSMFCAVSASSILGILIPMVFKKINIDPAVASGPFITTLNDVIGLTIYLFLATILLSHVL
ncbi:MAG: magnesium transporter [Candidatus Auribacterota bacterium]